MYATPSAAPGTGIGRDEQMQGPGGALRQGATPGRAGRLPHPYRPYGHPDLVLGRAVAPCITDDQAELISSTRLGDVLIEQIAAERGQTGSVVRMRRKRAERKLVTAIQRGELAVPHRIMAATA